MMKDVVTIAPLAGEPGDGSIHDDLPVPTGTVRQDAI
jgi:hypothetical protein